MAEAKEAWSEVGAAFGGLGEKLKDHFSHPPSRAADSPADSTTAGGAPADVGSTETTGTTGSTASSGATGDAGATAATGATGSTESSATNDAGASDALKDAFRTLGEALNGAVEAVGSAAKDPAIASDVRHVGQALVNALSATFTDAGEEVRKAFNRGRAADESTGTTGQTDAGEGPRSASRDQPDATGPSSA